MAVRSSTSPHSWSTTAAGSPCHTAPTSTAQHPPTAIRLAADASSGATQPSSPAPHLPPPPHSPHPHPPPHPPPLPLLSHPPPPLHPSLPLCERAAAPRAPREALPERG
ncbi:unnamed protein product [Closterium sp. NIES-53]